MTVLITGGSRGIGAATVRAFADSENVAFTYNASEESATLLEKQLRAFGKNASAFRCDVTSAESVQRLCSDVKKRFGAVDVIVNCAGIADRRLFQDYTDDAWRKLFDVNCDGAFRVTRAFLPDMIGRKCGSVINVSSVWGVVGASTETAYSASKAALIGMTRALAKEVAPSGVRVNAVAPGVVDTDMMSGYGKEERNALCESIPLGRFAAPEEIASAIVFLAKHPYITGQVLTVDGGFTL